MPCILFSSKIEKPENFASYNSALELIKLGFRQSSENTWEFDEAKMIDAKFELACCIDVPTNLETDFFIVLSPHRSKSKFQSLTVHIPGNWNNAEYGGSPRTLNIAYPSVQKALLVKMHEKNARYGLNFNVSYEVDHHGPTIKKPIIFIEIGSSVNEWKNPLAARIIAETVFETISKYKNQPSKSETLFGVGGGHYAPKFTKLAIEKDFVFGHILPKYQTNSINQDTFKQAIEKTLEKTEKIALDKKGVTTEQRKKIKELAEEFAIEIIEV